MFSFTITSIENTDIFEDRMSPIIYYETRKTHPFLFEIYSIKRKFHNLNKHYIVFVDNSGYVYLELYFSKLTDKFCGSELRYDLKVEELKELITDEHYLKLTINK